jgi:segregation and condensation protein B
MGSRRLAQLADLADGTQTRTLVRKLNRAYDAGGCAFRVVEVAGGYQLMTRPKFASWLRRLQPANVEVRLSSPAMETLAVVAYRQPVLRAEIEAIRGVQCGEILRQLLERDLVRIVGRSEELGRPFLYGTTRAFLQAFGLRHLDELPRLARVNTMLSTSNEPAGLNGSRRLPTDPSVNPSQTQEESDVKTSIEPRPFTEEVVAVIAGISEPQLAAPRDEDDDLEDEDDDLEDDEEYDDEEDEDLEEEEDDWEEVDDEDYDEAEEEEEEEWDEEDDEDWEDDEDEDEEEWEEDEE